MLRLLKKALSSAVPKILITPNMTLMEFANQLEIPLPQVLEAVKQIENIRFQPQESISAQTAQILSHEFGYIPEIQQTSQLPLRPPIVTIMGHVDHGKTTLLDSLRNSNLCGGEYGGITQGVGAFTIQGKSGAMTFIDTPGHQAFFSMRARGASVTDIVVLVVCAVQGVQQQTLECIRHATQVGVPIIVAFNKIDLPNSNIQRVQIQLLQAGIQLDKFGGDTLHTQISAKQKLGLEQLEELISFKAELMELRANDYRRGSGTVIQSIQKEGRGTICSVIVRSGVLRVGDFVVAGQQHGRVKYLVNQYGQKLQSAGPSDAVEILGLKEVPQAGDLVLSVDSLQKAKKLAERKSYLFEKSISQQIQQVKIPLPRLTYFQRYKLRRRDTSVLVQRLQKEAQLLKQGKLQSSTFKTMMKKSEKSIDQQILDIKNVFKNTEEQKVKLVIKAQNSGMLEAVEQGIQAVSQKTGFSVEIVYKGIGPLTSEDLNIAADFQSRILCMDLVLPKSIQNLATKLKVGVKTYKIIYHLLEDVEKMVDDFTSPDEIQEQIGKARVQAVFDLDKKKGTQVAGLEIFQGFLTNKSRIRVLRMGEEVAAGLEISSLKQFKDQAKEVQKGQQCGISLEGFNQFEPGDELWAYSIKKRIDIYQD